jgi:hypothetical protein
MNDAMKANSKVPVFLDCVFAGRTIQRRASDSTSFHRLGGVLSLDLRPGTRAGHGCKITWCRWVSAQASGSGTAMGGDAGVQAEPVEGDRTGKPRSEQPQVVTNFW